ncbi:hypothetical protein QBC32DRAFT_316848 [Pseudoneurospora amorphoporcata]|uniref:Uncharacterized protein n=1 Tax=Pseudoneurospora amorphoporcata TaxID=241081 RepID=A0AAN6NQQ5_9PEZI|nr:hypothetical protein QBC32DRAFT_316848 [Pseudoneurospora amorphoporcata]
METITKTVVMTITITQAADAADATSFASALFYLVSAFFSAAKSAFAAAAVTTNPDHHPGPSLPLLLLRYLFSFRSILFFIGMPAVPGNGYHGQSRYQYRGQLPGTTTTTTITTTTTKMPPLPDASSSAAAAAANAAKVDVFTKVVAGLAALVGAFWVATQIWSKCRGDRQGWRHKEEKWRVKLEEWELNKAKMELKNADRALEVDKKRKEALGDGGAAAAAAAVGGVGPGNLHRRATNLNLANTTSP